MDNLTIVSIVGLIICAIVVICVIIFRKKFEKYHIVTLLSAYAVVALCCILVLPTKKETYTEQVTVLNTEFKNLGYWTYFEKDDEKLCVGTSNYENIMKFIEGKKIELTYERVPWFGEDKYAYVSSKLVKD